MKNSDHDSGWVCVSYAIVSIIALACITGVVSFMAHPSVLVVAFFAVMFLLPLVAYLMILKNTITRIESNLDENNTLLTAVGSEECVVGLTESIAFTTTRMDGTVQNVTILPPRTLVSVNYTDILAGKNVLPVHPLSDGCVLDSMTAYVTKDKLYAVE